MQTEKFQIPSGKVITIREMNGEDEITLSQEQAIKEGSHLNTFVSRIITETSEDLSTDENPNKKLYTPQDIALWPLADKYFVTLKARVLSLGNILEFNFRFNEAGEDPKGYNYEEDLNKFITDLSNYSNLTTEEIEALDDNCVKPYPHGEQRLFEETLSSGKEIRWSLLSSYGEKLVLAKMDGTVSRNDDFFSRKLEMKFGDKYRILDTLRDFTAKELMEIRGIFKRKDTQFVMPVEVKSPKTGNIRVIPATALEEFFFPTSTQF